MWFNIVLENHGGATEVIALSPVVAYLRGMLSACGHEVTVVYDNIYPKAINLYLEHFVGDAFAENVDRVTHGRGRARASTTHSDERKVHLLREVRDLLRRCHVPGTGLVEAADLRWMQRSLDDPLEYRPELLG